MQYCSWKYRKLQTHLILPLQLQNERIIAGFNVHLKSFRRPNVRALELSATNTFFRHAFIEQVNV